MTIRTRLIGLRSSGSVGGSGRGRARGEGKGKARGVVGSVSAASIVSMASEEQRSDGRQRFLDLLLRSWTPLSAAVTAVQLALRLGKLGSIGDNGYECTCSGRGETSIRAVDMMLVVVVVGAR